MRYTQSLVNQALFGSWADLTKVKSAIVTLTPVGTPQVVQMSRHALAAVAFGMLIGSGRQCEPRPSGRFKQT
jgi:hypothetical protein